VNEKLLKDTDEVSTSVVEAVDGGLEDLFSKHLSFGLESPVKGKKGNGFEDDADELEAFGDDIEDEGDESF
jgi:hypothetical protein